MAVPDPLGPLRATALGTTLPTPFQAAVLGTQRTQYPGRRLV